MTKAGWVGYAIRHFSFGNPPAAWQPFPFRRRINHGWQNQFPWTSGSSDFGRVSAGGLLPTAVACDIIFWVTHNPNWAHISYWLIAAGVISGVVAAIFGLADWVGARQRDAGKTAGRLASRC